jgi:uncharacterized membrane protein
MDPIFKNDAIVFGLLMAVLGLVFYTSHSKNRIFKAFYKVVPALLMCYLIPSLLNTFGVVSDEHSELYKMAKLYLLPASLALMTLSIDLRGILRLGPKSLIMFFTATVGIVIGGPLAILFVSWVSPETVGGVGHNEVWRGLATLAGSWIGGGANQVAMLELYGYNEKLYSGMVAVDIIVANIWMAFLLYGAGRFEAIDKWLKADSSAIEQLKNKVQAYSESITKVPTLADIFMVLGVGFGATALAHWFSDMFTNWIGLYHPDWSGSIMGSSFFWIVVIATTAGLVLSTTGMRKLEGSGASKIGSVFIYILVATIGMKMDVMKTFENPGLILIGLIWITIHALLLFGIAKLIKAPFFFIAVGSTANVGGAASAPVVASAFHPALAPVGVLLAVLGYALGTYGAILCAQLMQLVSP